MTIIPQSEFRALGSPKDLTSVRIMELGNKKNRSGLYRHWYEAIGGGYFSTDINGKDGTIPWDIREPAPEAVAALAPFDIVTNFGFTEHVQDRQAVCWENVHNLVHPAYGRLSCVLPAPGHWVHHGIPSGFPGRWYPHPMFFTRFAAMNHYVIDDLWVDDKAHLVCCRMHRVPDITSTHRAIDFNFPGGALFDNVNDIFKGDLIW